MYFDDFFYDFFFCEDGFHFHWLFPLIRFGSDIDRFDDWGFGHTSDIVVYESCMISFVQVAIYVGGASSEGVGFADFYGHGAFFT